MKVKNDETHLKLLKTAASEFASKGYASTNINEVSKKAGFGKGTIYNYFQNKSDLFLSVFTHTMNEISDFIKSEIKDIIDPLEKLKAALRADFEYFKANKELTLIILRESYSADKSNQENYMKAGEPLFLLYMNIINEGIEADYFQKDTNPLLTTIMLIGMSENLILMENVLNADFGTTEDLAQRVLSMLLKGIQK